MEDAQDLRPANAMSSGPKAPFPFCMTFIDLRE